MGCASRILMDTERTPSPSPRSSLFTLRLWVEEVRSGEHEVRMQVKHVLSGETHYFREWHELIAFLQMKVDNPLP
jgi:hypothetical protein